MPAPMPKFSNITQVAMPDRAMDEGYSQQDEERDVGEEILRNWITVARWNWSDREVADMLCKAGDTLRERATK